MGIARCAFLALALLATPLPAPIRGVAGRPAQASAGLAVPVAAFAAGVSGYGQFQPRDSVFRPGEQLHVYLAPAGYALQSNGQSFHLELAVNVRILNSDGKAIARVDDFSRLVNDSPTERRDIYADLTLTLPSLRSGSYRLELTLLDLMAKERATASTTLAFSIMP